MKINRILPVGPVNWRKNLEERRKLDQPKRELPETKKELIFDFHQFQEERRKRNLLNYLPWRFNRISVLFLLLNSIMGHLRPDFLCTGFL